MSYAKSILKAADQILDQPKPTKPKKPNSELIADVKFYSWVVLIIAFVMTLFSLPHYAEIPLCEYQEIGNYKAAYPELETSHEMADGYISNAEYLEIKCRIHLIQEEQAKKMLR